tara:strand:- start:2222 stop:2674 length:453 start_codon:yes stop_codon:yes gene_type:complete
MAIRKRETPVPPAPQRSYASGQQQASSDANDDIAFWTLVGGIGGAAVGAGAGFAVGGPGGALAGGLGGWGVGSSAGNMISSSFAADAQADYAVAQQELDSDRMVTAMHADLEMEQEARDFARRMSSLNGISANTPDVNKSGYKWGGYIRS